MNLRNTMSIILVVLLFLSVPVFAAMQAYVPSTLHTGQSFNITGYIKASNGSAVSNVNVTVNISGNVTTGLTDSTGYYTFNITGMSTNGTYSVNVSNNYSSITKQIPLHVTNATNISIVFLNTNFSTSNTFTINITLRNSTGGTIYNYYPLVKVVKENSGKQNWTITNLSNGTNSAGSILYNITIPSTASTGDYAVIVERGTGFAPFYVTSNLRLIAKTKDCNLATGSCEDTTKFYPGENVTVSAKLRYSNNTAITGQSVVARITLANGTTSSLTLSEVGDGLYESNYSTPSGASGSVSLSVSATVSGSTVSTTTSSKISTIDVRLAAKTSGGDKILEFGKFKGARPGDTLTYLVMVSNESSGEQFTSAANGGGGTVVNCSAIRLNDFVRTENSTSYNASVAGSFTTSTATKFGTTVCSVSITSPTATGTYKWSVVVPFNGTDYNASVHVPVQQYVLRLFPQSSTATSGGGGGPGGGGMFQQMFRPGTNVTFRVEAYDVNGTKVSDANLSNVNATSMFNLPTFTKLVAGTDFTITNITQTSSLNSITVTLPTTYTDAFTFEAKGTLFGTTVITGDTFFFSKYVVGFMGPSISATGGHGGMGMSAESACEGTETFRGDVRLADTFETISGVQLHAAPKMAMSERTGKSIVNCVTFTETVSTNITPSIITNVSFNSSCSLSGRYFMLANVTFTDENNVAHEDSLPAFFKCSKLSGSFDVTDAENNFQVASDATLNVSASSFLYINGSNVSSGTITVLGIYIHQFDAFGPPESYSVNSSHTMEFDLVNGSATFNMYPQNFTVPNAKWSQSQGFIDFKFQVCSNSLCGTFEKGVMIDSSIKAWWTSMPGSLQLVPGDVLTLNINARTNVSNVTAGFESFGIMGSTSAFTIAGKTVDLWNSTADDASGYETWEVNITVPEGLRKGGSSIVLTINSSASGSEGEKATLRTFGTTQGATVGIAQADMQLTSNIDLTPTTASSNATLLSNGWNFSFIMSNISGFTDVNLSRAVSFANNISINLFNPMGMQQLMIDSNISMLILIRNGTTSTTYDTVLLRNTSMGNSATNASAFTVVNVTNRSFGFGGLYLWQILGSSYLKVVNANASNSDLRTDAGMQSTNTEFIIPYIVRQGNVSAENVTVNITKVYQETDMGFGLGSEYTGYTVSAATTNADGVALVTLNISGSGRYKLFWNVNGSVNESATQSSMFMGAGGFSTGPTQVNIRGFGVAMNFLTDNMNTSVFNITNKSNAAWNFFSGWGAGDELFNGTIPNFLNSSDTLYLAVNNSNNETKLNWTQYNQLSTCTSSPCLLSSTHNFNDVMLGVSAYRSLDADTYSIALYNGTMGSSGWCKKVKSSTETVYVRICAQAFGALTTSGYAGANISAVWGNAGGTQTPATIRDPITDSAVESVVTGPSGCVAFRVNTTWPEWGGQLGVNITYGGTTETVNSLNIGQNQYCMGPTG